MARWLTLLALVGCGVVAPPRPPGPGRPAAPTDVVVRSSPAGLEVSATLPTADVDGEPLLAPPVLLVFVDQPRCEGVPAARGSTSPVVVPLSADRAEVRVVAAHQGQQGEASAPRVVVRRPLPDPPQAPLVFVDSEGAVQISWLPPEPPATHVRLLRDGRVVGHFPAQAAVASDAPEAGAHRYALVAEGADFVTAPSPAVPVTVADRSPAP